MPGDVTQTLLLIEDDPHLPLLLEHMLERRWTAVAQKLVCVTSLRQALAVLETEPVSAILLDLSLPDASGLAGLRALRAASAQVPILVLTGNPDVTQAVDAIRLGATEYLIKGEIGAPMLVRALAMAQARTQLPTGVQVAQRQDGAFQVTYMSLTSILSGEEFGKRLTQQSVGLDCVQCLARWVERGTAVLRPLIITQGA